MRRSRTKGRRGKVARKKLVAAGEKRAAWKSFFLYSYRRGRHNYRFLINRLKCKYLLQRVRLQCSARKGKREWGGGGGGTRVEERRVNGKRNRDREREKRGGKREGEGGGREREEEA